MDSVYALRLAKAVNDAQRGGDFIDHGWSVLKTLHREGFDVVVRDRAISALHVGKSLNEMARLPAALSALDTEEGA